MPKELSIVRSNNNDAYSFANSDIVNEEFRIVSTEQVHKQLATVSKELITGITNHYDIENVL